MTPICTIDSPVVEHNPIKPAEVSRSAEKLQDRSTLPGTLTARLETLYEGGLDEIIPVKTLVFKGH